MPGRPADRAIPENRAAGGRGFTTTYVGADAQTVEQSVATPIEQQMSGVDNMNYMYSINGSDGSMRMIVDFDVATDPNTDLILSQMRQTQSELPAPADVAAYGVTVQKQLTAPLMLIALYSPHGTYDSTFLANYAYININDRLTRVPGIASANVFGAGQYAMRFWVKPDQLAKLNITVGEVIQAIQAQNTVNPTGLIGGEPAPAGAGIHLFGSRPGPAHFTRRSSGISSSARTQRLRRPAPATWPGSNSARRSTTSSGRLDGKAAANIAVYQLPGSNALDCAKGVRQAMEELKEALPPGSRIHGRPRHDPRHFRGNPRDLDHALGGAGAGRSWSSSSSSRAGGRR